MKELQVALDLAHHVLNEGRPNLGSEMAVRTFVGLYFGLLREPPQVRYHIYQNIIPDAIAGKKRSMAQDAEVLLSPYSLRVTGTENIPNDGPLLVTPNHWSRGPLNSYWTHLALARKIWEVTPEAKRLRFIVQNALLIPGTNKKVPFTDKTSSMLADLYDVLKVPPPKIREKDKKATQTELAREIVQSFKEERAVGLYPELTSSTAIQEGHPLAGLLALKYLRITKEGLILPVGVYSGKDNKLFINFGEPYSSVELAFFIPSTRNPIIVEKLYREAANFMMSKINPLVPERLRDPILHPDFIKDVARSIEAA